MSRTREYKKFAKAAEDDGFDLDDPADAVTLAAFVVGPNVRRIAQFLGRPERWCRGLARSLREQGVWRGAKIVLSGDEVDGVEIALQSGVARGWFEMVPS